MLSWTRRGAQQRSRFEVGHLARRMGADVAASATGGTAHRGTQEPMRPAKRPGRDTQRNDDGDARLEAAKPDKSNGNDQSVGSKGRNCECCSHAATLTALARLGGRGRGAPNRSGRNLSRGMPVAASTASTRSDGMRPVWHQFHTFCFVHPHAFPSFSREPAARTACLTMFSLMGPLNHKRRATSRLH